MSLGVIVQDDVVIDPYDYRRQALLATYRDVALGPDVFRGVAPITPITPYYHDDLHWFINGNGGKTTLSFFRRSPADQPEPHYIHHDAMMGDWTAILFLNPEPHPGDGTVFWEHKSGAFSGDVDMDDVSQFTERFRVKAQFNRAVIFPSHWFHSRALFENYGEGDDARLIQVAFGKVL